MYTVQALWTMAREGLDVTVLVFANRAYQILRGELTNVGVRKPGPARRRHADARPPRARLGRDGARAWASRPPVSLIASRSPRRSRPASRRAVPTSSRLSSEPARLDLEHWQSMTPADILAHPPIRMTDAQRRQYFERGFVAIPNAIPDDWVQRLRLLSDEFLEASRRFDKTDEVFDLGPSHAPDRPHVRGLKALVDRHPDFWAFASRSPLTDIAADLLGPDVKFHSSKLNYKWPGQGEVVKWHQDITAWPHANYSLVTLGVHLDDVSPDAGPLSCVPGSHEGELHVHRDKQGRWTGSIAEDSLSGAGLDKAEDMLGGAGTVIAIHCRVLHASRANLTDRVRALPLFVFSSADAFPWMPAPSPTRKTGQIVRGQPATVAHLDPRPCPVPPNWAEEGYNSIFAAQKK